MKERRKRLFVCALDVYTCGYIAVDGDTVRISSLFFNI